MNNVEKMKEFVASKVVIGTSVTWKHNVDRRQRQRRLFISLFFFVINIVVSLPSNRRGLGGKILLKISETNSMELENLYNKIVFLQ
jgi:hypothetical protein